MNLLTVPHTTIGYNNPADVVTAIFSKYKANKIAFEPWPGDGIKPDVNFKIAYGDDAIFLKFCVAEQYYRAFYKQVNDPVYKDCCVEFFIGFGGDGAYYNFEFNAIGTALVGYGTGKERELIDPALVRQIKYYPVNKLQFGANLPFYWELVLVIPFAVFSRHRIVSLKGAHCFGNFFKCGNDLPHSHYLCWNNIIADNPEFHLPEYFGKLIFE